MYCSRSGGVAPLILNVVESIVLFSVMGRLFVWQISNNISKNLLLELSALKVEDSGLTDTLVTFYQNYAASFRRGPQSL